MHYADIRSTPLDDGIQMERWDAKINKQNMQIMECGWKPVTHYQSLWLKDENKDCSSYKKQA